MVTTRSVMHLVRPRPAGDVGGADLHVADLAEAQVAQGWDVTVISFGNPDYVALLRGRGIDVVTVAGEGLGTWYKAVVRAVSQRQPSVVHSHGYRADIVAAALRQWAWRRPGGRPALVMSVHGFIRISLAFRALTYLNERCLRAADLVVTSSSQEAHRLARGGLGPVQFIANGVRVPLMDRQDHADTPTSTSTGRRIAFVGRLSQEKRPDLFVHMAELVLERRPDSTFFIVGTGPLQQRVHDLVRQLGIADRVRLLGLRDDVDELLRDVDVLVCPSDTEGTPRVVVEAMSAGVPVVATRVGGLPDLVSDGLTGLLVPPGDGAALAGAVDILLGDRDLAQRIATAAADSARTRFAIDSMERQVAEAYAAALKLAEAAR